MFNLPSYTEILKTSLRCNYSFIGYADFLSISQEKRIIILRHDIDFSPTIALEIARIANAHSIKSSFLFLTRSQIYNVFSYYNIDIVE